MAEKRFGVITNWCIYENVDGVKKWLNFDEVVDLLNQLNDENGWLQKKNDNLVNMIARVQYRADLIKDENEQLKKDVDYWKQVASQYSNEVNVLEHKLKGID